MLVWLCHRNSLGRYVRLSIIALKPACCHLVALDRLLLIAYFLFIEFREILLMCCCSAEVALSCVVVDRDIQAPRRIQRIRLAVDLEGLDICVRSIIWFGKLRQLDRGRALERMASFLSCGVGLAGSWYVWMHVCDVLSFCIRNALAACV